MFLCVSCLDSSLLFLRLCSTAVYIFGALLEHEAMVQKLQEWTHTDENLCWILGQLLLRDEPDVVLNAVGAIASLVMFTQLEMFHVLSLFKPSCHIHSLDVL